MVLHRVASAALVLLVLALWGGVTAGKDKETRRHHRMEVLAAKLNLSDQQKEKLSKIEDEFDRKAAPIENQLWTLHHEEHEAMGKVLTKEQRAKLPETIKRMMRKQGDAFAARLGLNEKQKEQLHKIEVEYAEKFEKAAHDKSEKSAERFCELKHEELAAICQELTPEQRLEAPGVLRREIRHWRHHAAWRNAMKEVADELGLSEDQRTQVKKIHEEYEPKLKEPVKQFHHLFKEEQQEMEKVLSKEQRATLHKLLRKGEKAGKNKTEK